MKAVFSTHSRWFTNVLEESPIICVMYVRVDVCRGVCMRMCVLVRVWVEINR